MLVVAKYLSPVVRKLLFVGCLLFAVARCCLLLVAVCFGVSAAVSAVCW